MLFLEVITVDSSFGTSCVTRTIFGGDDVINSLAIQTDGKIIAGGKLKTLGGGTRPAYFALARYNANGKPDSTFGNQGKLTTSFENFGNRQYYYAKKILLQPDKKIIALGDADIKQFNKSVFAVARYLNDVGAMPSQVQNISRQHNVKISPNPAVIMLHIDGLLLDTKLTVIDFAGTIKLQAVANNSPYSLNISSLPTGNYLLRLKQVMM